MAKSGTPRHAKPTRQPVTIDHDPAPKPKAGDAVNPKTHIADAEPVGDFSKKKAPDTSAPKVTASAGSNAAQSATSKASPSKDAGSVSSSHMQSDTKNTSPEAKPAAVKNTRNTGANLAAGIVGGIIALAGAAALQWGNIIPSPATSAPETQVTAEQLAQLQQEIAALKAAPVTAGLSQSDQQKLDQAASLAKTSADKMNEVASATTAKIAEMQKQLTNLPTSMPANVDIDGLSAKIAALETQLTATSSKANEAAADVTSEKNSISALQEQLSALQEKIAETSQQPDKAVLIAANALKSAIDRGGSYVSELDTLKSLAPTNPTIENLTPHASTGIPTIAALNAQVSGVAEKIVATENKIPADAAFWDHLIASAKGLISVRPVGDIPGTGAGPTTARMEAALQAGDLERAINEWEKLPEDAKAVSQDLADQMKLRRDTDQLISRLMTQTVLPKTNADTPQAAQ